MIAAPTFSQIKAQVTAILQRSPHSQVIGIHAQSRWTGDRQQYDGNQCYLIDQCDSPLAPRVALQKGQQERETNDTLKTAIQVLITPLTEKELAEDILVRFAKQRLFEMVLHFPHWWETAPISIPEPLAQPPQPKPDQPDFGPLFSYAVSTEKASVPTQSPDWISRLVQSPIYAVQTQLIGDTHLSEETVIKILTALNSQNGTLSASGLARLLNYPLPELKALLVTLALVPSNGWFETVFWVGFD